MDEWTPGEIRFMVCSRLVSYSVPKALRALINERCKPDIRTYITNNHDKIERIKPLPPYMDAPLQLNPTINKWDITSLVWFLTHVTTVELPERRQLDNIRKIRNEIVHCSQGHLNEQQYKCIVFDIESALSYFEKITNIDFDLNKEIKQINITINRKAARKQYREMVASLKSWYHTDAQVGKAVIFKPIDTTLKLNRSDIPVGKATIIKPGSTTITRDEPSATAIVESRSRMIMSIHNRQLFGEFFFFCNLALSLHSIWDCKCLVNLNKL